MSLRIGIAFWLLAYALFSSSAQSEEVVQATVCQIISDPASFDHKLVEIEGTASQGMENFSLSTKPCHQKNNFTGIWLEYGGRVRSGAKFCCGVPMERGRPEDLVVDGIATSLIEDDRFRAFDSRIHPNGHVRARLIGRYFAGHRSDRRIFNDPDSYLWGGYGHMGMYSLLVIQQVIRIEASQDLK
ncbi:MAG: hypothetical protein ACLQNV_12490 [Steroidobacteraceae bacterium]|jgi:hypothetical protein